MTNTLSMRGISKSFFGVEVLHKVDFTIEPTVVVTSENVSKYMDEAY